ncbi:hypothetical protein JCM8115_003900 [Rhodotorula mucilaginosa]
MRSILVAAAALSLAVPSDAALVERWLNISYTTASPDGVDKPFTVGTNGTWPPPPLEVRANDTVRVHALNSLDHPTSIHHHGIFFNGSAYYDGAPSITQCGIPSGESLTYEVPVDLQHGTYWYHSHTGIDYQDGMRAPLVIHAEQEAHAYDDEFTIVLSDWYYERATKLNNKFMNKYNPTGAEPIPDSLLIYASHNGSYLSSGDEVQFNDNLALPFEAGKTYRLRVVNAGIFAMTFFWIDGHDMRIIEVDGIDIEEFPVDHLTLSVAQRYSVLVTARNDTSENFYMHANFDSMMFDTVPEDLQLNYTASISYGSGNPMAPAETRDTLDEIMDDFNMVPIVVQPQLVPNTDVELDVYFDAYDNGVNRASMLDNITFVPPETPSLMTMLSMGNDSLNPAVYGPQTAAKILDKFDVVNLLLINFDANAHPFHLHGHTFQITRRASDVTSSDPLLNPPHWFNATNPMRRDTIVVPAGGAVNLQWVADNPGAWIFHCHIQWHMESGLAVVFMSDIPGAQQTLTLPQAIKDQCQALGVSATGNAGGKMSVTDLGNAPKGPQDQEHILGWTPKAKGALAGCVITAVLGMLSVVWYAIGGQLDAEELEEEVERDMAQKAAKGGGYKKRAFNAVFRRNQPAAA